MTENVRLPDSVDVVIVGGGTAGAAAAAAFAGRGARTLCVDRKDLTESGARWVNGVPRRLLAEAGLAVPDGHHGPRPFNLIAGAARLRVAEHDVVDLDMRALVATLHERARSLGAELVGGVTVRGRDGDRLMTDAGAVRARWIVDAGGLAGPRLLGQAAVAPTDLCAAAQGVYEVKDPAGAAAYYASLGVKPGEVIGVLGVAGGFSILNVCWHVDAGTVGVLTGSIPALGHPGGKTLRDDFVRSQPWIGPMQFGGAAAIPLRRAYDRLVDDRVALLGDAGCQVFAAHGSGIGAGLVAARLLADTLTGGGDLRAYEVAWHRRWGGLFAVYDAARRMSQGMDPAQLADALAHGLIDHAMVKASLDQELPRISAAMVAARLRAVRRAPTMAVPLVRAMAQMGAVQALSGLYPRDLRAADLWTRVMNRVLAV